MNNDGELAIDISESDEMEELLQKEIDNQVSRSWFVAFDAVGYQFKQIFITFYTFNYHKIFLGSEL